MIANRTIDTSSINRNKSPTTFHLYFNLETTQISSSTCATCTLQNLYRLRIFNKLELSRLDTRLSSFIIISSYIHTLSWCRRVVRSSRNWEHLTAIKLITWQEFRLSSRPFKLQQLRNLNSEIECK